jgi:hypothetical protein
VTALRWTEDVFHPATYEWLGPPAGARRHVTDFARTLALTCLSPGVQVVLAEASGWPGRVITTGQAAPQAIDLAEMMLASESIVVPADRMPSPCARAAAKTWGTDRLLVAPAVFGHDVVAVGLTAVPVGVRPHLAAADAAGERLAAALTAYQLGFELAAS